jgi:hypothetical protein
VGLIKNNMLGDHDAVSGKIKSEIPFVVLGIADEDTTSGTKSKLMWGCHRQVEVAGTPKDPEMLIGR